MSDDWVGRSALGSTFKRFASLFKIPLNAGKNQPQMVFGTTPIPTAIKNLVTGKYYATTQVVAILQFVQDATHYWFDALISDNTQQFFGIVRGVVGPASEITQTFIYNLISAGVGLELGTGGFDGAIIIGSHGGAGIDILGDPQDRTDIYSLGQLVARFNHVVGLNLTSQSTLPAFGPLGIDGVDQGRGVLAVTGLTAAAVVGVATSTISGVISNFVFKNLRTYRLSYSVNYTLSAATNSMTVDFNIGGNTQHGANGPTGANSSGWESWHECEIYVINALGVDTTYNCSLVGTCNAGTATIGPQIGTHNGFFMIEDVGADHIFNNNPTARYLQ